MRASTPRLVSLVLWKVGLRLREVTRRRLRPGRNEDGGVPNGRHRNRTPANARDEQWVAMRRPDDWQPPCDGNPFAAQCQPWRHWAPNTNALPLAPNAKSSHGAVGMNLRSGAMNNALSLQNVGGRGGPRIAPCLWRPRRPPPPSPLCPANNEVPKNTVQTAVFVGPDTEGGGGYKRKYRDRRALHAVGPAGSQPQTWSHGPPPDAFRIVSLSCDRQPKEATAGTALQRGQPDTLSHALHQGVRHAGASEWRFGGARPWPGGSWGENPSAA